MLPLEVSFVPLMKGDRREVALAVVVEAAVGPVGAADGGNQLSVLKGQGGGRKDGVGQRVGARVAGGEQDGADLRQAGPEPLIPSLAEPAPNSRHADQELGEVDSARGAQVGRQPQDVAADGAEGLQLAKLGSVARGMASERMSSTAAVLGCSNAATSLR